jgi:hypothetical protein
MKRFDFKINCYKYYMAIKKYIWITILYQLLFHIIEKNPISKKLLTQY